MFDRFDIVEAYYVLAHDYGLYALHSRIERKLRLPARPSLCLETLSENAREIYDRVALKCQEMGNRLDSYNPYPFREPQGQDDETPATLQKVSECHAGMTIETLDSKGVPTGNVYRIGTMYPKIFARTRTGEKTFLEPDTYCRIVWETAFTFE